MCEPRRRLPRRAKPKRGDEMKSNRAKNSVLAKSVEFVFITSVLLGMSLLPPVSAPPPQTPNYGPNGPYCAIKVPSGTVIFGRYSYKVPNGTKISWNPLICPGDLVDIAPNIQGNIEWGQHILNSGSTFTSLQSSWTVPNAPAHTEDAPTNFFWNGLISESGQWLMQPVLGWGCARYRNDTVSQCRVGGTYWWLSAILDDTSTGIFYWQTPKNNVAGPITGTLTKSSSISQCNPYTSGVGWYIQATDSSQGTSQLIFCDTSYYTRGYAAVFEAKGCTGGTDCSQSTGGISRCDNLANSPNINFTSISSTPSSGVTWASTNGGLSPSCGWGMNPAFGSSTSSNSDPIRLRWNPACSSPPC